MKKILQYLFVVIFVFLGNQVDAQAYEPLVVEGATWCMLDSDEDYTVHRPFILRMEGDTVHNGMVYKKVFSKSIQFTNQGVITSEESLMAMLREDVSLKRVYAYYFEDSDLIVCERPESEFVLYDFNASMGGPITECDPGSNYNLVSEDRQVLFGKDRRFLNGGGRKFIEGIGSDKGLFFQHITHAGKGIGLKNYCVGDEADCITTFFPNNPHGCFVQNEKKWVEANFDNFVSGSINSSWVKIGNTTGLLSGDRYFYHLYRTKDEAGNNFEISYHEGVREDAGKVFYQIYTDEYLLYDFNMNIGDKYYAQYDSLVITAIDSVEIDNGDFRRRLHLGCISGFQDTYTWIDGVGDSQLGLMAPLQYCTVDYPTVLLCHYEDDDLVYTNPQYNTCWLVGTDDILLDAGSLFPNPSTNLINIKNENIKNVDKYTVYNIMGEMVINGSIGGGSINVEHLHQGQYLIKIYSDKAIYNAVFVKM